MCSLHTSFWRKVYKCNWYVYKTLKKDAIPSLFFYGDEDLKYEESNETTQSDIVANFQTIKTYFQERVQIENWQYFDKDCEVFAKTWRSKFFIRMIYLMTTLLPFLFVPTFTYTSSLLKYLANYVQIMEETTN